MGQVTINTPDGKTLTVPYEGAPPTPDDIKSIVDHYEATRGAQAATPAPAQANPPPATPVPVPATPPAATQTRPLVPPATGPTVNDAAVVAMQGATAQYKRLAQAGKITRGDIDGHQQKVSMFLAQNPQYLQTAEGRAWVKQMQGFGWDVSVPKPGPPSFGDNLLANLERVGVGVAHAPEALVKTVAAGLGASLGIGADSYEAAQRGEDPGTQYLTRQANAAAAPLVGPESLLGHGAQAAQQGPQALSQFVKGVPAGVAHEAYTNPVDELTNVASLLPLVGGAARVVGTAGKAVGAARGLAGDIAAADLTPKDVAAMTGEGPELHPTAPGANGAARAVDGKFVPVPEAPAEAPAPALPHVEPTPHKGNMPDVERAQQIAEGIIAGRFKRQNVLGTIKGDQQAYNQYVISGDDEMARIHSEQVATRQHAIKIADQVKPPPQAPAPPQAAEVTSAPETAPAAPATPKTPAPNGSTPNMAGSVNLDNLTTTPEATARLKQSGDSAQTVAPQGHAEIEKAADALSLRPEHLTNLTPGEVPQGVHPAVFDTAIRKLNVAKQEQAAAADAAYQADKSPENLDALTKANMEAHGVLQHAQARARVSGQALSAYNIQASAYEGALAKTQGKQQALARTTALTDPTAAPKVPPRAKSYGANNTVFTQAARDAALERIREASGRLNAGVPLDVIRDAAIVGGYHLEAGLRKFGDWAAEMKKDVPGLSDEDLQRVWAATRAEYADKAKGNLKQTGQLVFADALAPRLGRQGVSEFMEELADQPGDLLGKLIRGESLTADERQTVNGVYRSHLPGRQGGRRSPSPQALNQLNGIVKEFTDQANRERLAKARQARVAARQQAKANAAPGTANSPRTPKTPPSPLQRALTGRLGPQGSKEFVARLSTDPATQGTLAKIEGGQPLTDAERRAVAGHLDDLKKPARAQGPSDISKMLTGVVRDAKAGRLGYPDAKAAVREELLGVVDDHRVPMLTKDLANVADGDFKGLAEVYNRYYPARFLDRARQVQQANLLSGPKTLGTIALAHAMGAGLEEAAVRPIAAAVGRGKVQGLNASATKATVGALGRGTKEAGRMMVEGPTAMQLRGMDPGYRIDLQPGRHIHPEFTSNTKSAAFNRLANVLVRVPGRAHAALYHALGTALEERGVQEAAALKARKQGGDPAQYVGDEDVKAAGAAYRAEQMYQNPNRAASAVNAASATAGPIGEAVINALMPFRNVPLNLAGRGLEYSGGPATVGTALARLKYLHKTGKDILNPRKALTADEREAIERNVSYQIARGIVGSGLVGGGYALSAKGAMNPPNGKDFENGSINGGRLKYDIGRLHPTAMPVEVGGELQRMRAHKPFDIAGPIEDNPYFNAAETVQNIKEGASGDTRKMAQGLGGIAGQAVPTALGQIAQATDPSGHVRKKKSMLDYLKNRVPGLREKLPVSPHWEQSNIRSTGPLSLLSPVNVHRRK